MKILINRLDDPTGWVIDSPSTLVVNEIRDYISGYNDASLLATFSKDDTTRRLLFNLGTPIDVSEYTSVVFSIWSQTFGSEVYRTADMYKYKISLGVGHEYTIPLSDTFNDVEIPIDQLDEITQIRIEPLHAETDSIVISDMYAELEELPDDSMISMKEALEIYRDREPEISVGTVTASTGDRSISLEGPWIAKYTCIKISDGVNSEIHQLGDQGDGTFKFLGNFDGFSIQNDYTNAEVTLFVPITINPNEQEVMSPGVVIWGFTPEAFTRSTRASIKTISYDLVNDVFVVRKEGQQFEQIIFIDIEARQNEQISKVARFVKKFVSTEVLWINGRKHELGYEATPIETQPPTGVTILPSLRFSAILEYEERINDNERQVPTTTININAIIKEG